VKLSLATVKILFSRGWALYREDSTLSMPELLRAALVHFVEPVEVIRKVKLMVGYTCQTPVRICKTFDFGLSEGLPWEGIALV
jgi:hypothetical protein